jgi:hypothetical protein
MAAVLCSALLICFASLFIGQAALRLAGAREWSWLAPPIGLSVAMLVAMPTVHLPGRSATMAGLLGMLTIAAAVWCLRSPSHRPPLLDLLAALPVVFLVLAPFLAAGRGGVLGVTINNDMTVHLRIVEGIISSGVAELYPLPSDYPLGPHALAAALSKGLGTEADLAFTGWTMAIPIISAWSVLAAARNASWFGKAVGATVAGMPFLVAAYYGQGSFKEIAQAGLVLAIALQMSGCGPRLERGRWVPLALLIGGVISAYSPAGLPWVVAIVGLWLVGQLAILARRRELRRVPQLIRRELPALAIGVGVIALALLPQAKRMWEFVAIRDGTGISVDDIGNLVGRLPGWEALGIWDSADYRLPASAAFTGGLWSWFVVALILFGTFWALRRGRWMLPLSAAAALLIWKYSDGSQSIYVTAKALTIASPLLLLVTVLPLIDREPGRGPRGPWGPRWVWLLVPLLGLVLFLRVFTDDLRALRFSPVGPTDHARQLMSLRPLVAGKSTLIFGEDEFLIWQMVGSKSRAVALAFIPQVPLRPEKKWELGEAIDFDTVPASALNEYEWVISPRDAASSAPPSQLHLVRSTDDFQLWRRVGRISERSTLQEGQWPGAVLRCDTKEGRAILAAGGVAAVRRPPIMAPGGAAVAGDSILIRIDLPAGRWQLEAPYTSHLPLEVTAPGLKTELPANLDRLGPRWPIGRVAVRHQRPVSISFKSEKAFLTPQTATANIAYVLATSLDDVNRVVPISRACGKYVDWYRSAR